MTIYQETMCQICTRSFKSALSNARHFTQIHNTKSEEYFNKFVSPSPGCLVCGNPTTFKSFTEGYSETCGHKCGCILHRKRLKTDDIKFSAFRNKVAVNQSRIWNEDPHGNVQKIREKIGKTISDSNSILTDTQRIEKYSRYYRCDEKTIERLNTIGRDQCLKNHKEGKSGYVRNYKGKFQPKHPEKYKGDPTNIIYRSSWELKLAMYLDDQPNVLEWSSEEIIIPYISPIDNKRHRYFVDFYVKKRTPGGKIEEMLIEVKPEAQMVEPKPRITKTGRPTKQYIKEVYTWGVNSAKWAAAESYCAQRGWIFQKMGAKDLGIR